MQPVFTWWSNPGGTKREDQTREDETKTIGRTCGNGSGSAPQRKIWYRTVASFSRATVNEKLDAFTGTIDSGTQELKLPAIVAEPHVSAMSAVNVMSWKTGPLRCSAGTQSRPNTDSMLRRSSTFTTCVHQRREPWYALTVKALRGCADVVKLW
jgi:hypothetical protein